VASSQNFGIVGNGKLDLFHLTESGLQPAASFYTRDALYDCAWSEERDTHIVSASGDGSIKLWDIKQPKPLRNFEEHTQECVSIDWNPVVRTGHQPS